MEILVNKGLDQKSWNYLVLQHPDATILQSWQWGEFQKSLGNKIWRLAVLDQGQPITQISIIKLSLKFGLNIFYAPRALFLNKTLPAHHQHQAMQMIVDKIKKLAKTERVILFRTDPPIHPGDNTSLSIFKSLGFVISPRSTQPKTNLQLDITAQTINLLMQMKQKTRYNIRLAEKKGITIHSTNKPDDMDIFNLLMRETAIRDNFISHTNDYYHHQLTTLGASKNLSLFIAYDKHTPLAAALVSFFGSTATYLHGASSNKYREKQAPYLLHWEIIKTAKKQGCAIYDLGGINLSQQHAWVGITRFKLGFGGKVVEYVGNLELPINKSWFRLYQLISYKRYA